MCLDRGSISKAVKGLVVRSVPRRRGSPGPVEGTKLARSAMREQGQSKTGIASLPHVKLSPMSGAVEGTKLARSAMREQGQSKTGIASLPHVKL